ncbi:MAG TPA: YezD family protein [Armatimonadota bacterium]|jgi:hypothetical protein
MDDRSNNREGTARVDDTSLLAAIQEALQNIRYGVVQIVIQDGRVVQIDRTEKTRLV